MSREIALGIECAALLAAQEGAPDWKAAKKYLDGAVSVRSLRDHWGLSARRVTVRLLILLATTATIAPRVVPAIEALGFVKLAQAIGTRCPRSPTGRDAALRYLGVSRYATAAEIRAAYRRKIIDERLHPDHGGDATRLQSAIEARKAAEKRA